MHVCIATENRVGLFIYFHGIEYVVKHLHCLFDLLYVSEQMVNHHKIERLQLLAVLLQQELGLFWESLVHSKQLGSPQADKQASWRQSDSLVFFIKLPKGRQSEKKAKESGPQQRKVEYEWNHLG